MPSWLDHFTFTHILALEHIMLLHTIFAVN